MPKPVRMMILASCPHCRRAFQLMEELKAAHPDYAGVSIEVIEEDKHPEIADALDYYYVPTFFVGGRKVHEGVPSREAIAAVFEEALRPESGARKKA